MSHGYDGCEECVARQLRLLHTPTIKRRPRPSPAALERHAERFGSEGVAETAAELGLEVDVPEHVRKRRSRRRAR